VSSLGIKFMWVQMWEARVKQTWLLAELGD
jgi:hypothetical protein